MNLAECLKICTLLDFFPCLFNCFSDLILETPVTQRVEDTVPKLHDLIVRAKMAKPTTPSDPFLDENGEKLTEENIFKLVSVENL